MRALPIDVVRAFVAVVDNRGFTRAAEELGRSQPTVSLQIKRLEELAGSSVFENSSRLTLTACGHTCLNYGRRLLALHDDMLEAMRRQNSSVDAVRLGMPNEFASLLVPSLADLARSDGPSFNFEFTCEMSETLLDRLRAHQLDVALAMTSAEDARDAVAHWQMPMSWVAAPNYRVPANGPIRLITPPEGSLFYNIAAGALQQAGRKFEVVCKSANHDVLRSAVDAGYGVSAVPTGLAPKGARLLPQNAMTSLPEVTLGLFALDGAGSAAREPLLAHMIDLLAASPALGTA